MKKTLKLMWLRAQLRISEWQFDNIHRTNMEVQANARATARMALEDMQRESLAASRLRVQIATLEGGA